MSLTPCRLKGVDHEALCGKLEVFENRATRSGRKLALNVAVVSSLSPTPEPDPLFILAGGPGQAAVELGGAVMPQFELELRHRDIVLVDQRGTGKSNGLGCEPPDAGSVESELSDEQTLARLKECLASYDADPRLYTTPIAMDDLDDVRAALGYARINLWGASYGTRAALVYLRQHGAHVRSATLDGVAPTDLKLPLSFALDGQRALDLLFAHCEADRDCNATYPKLRERFSQLLDQLERAPAKAKVPNPITGALEDVTISRKDFVTTLRGLLYLPEAASLMPLTIDRAIRGDFTPFAAEATGLSGGFMKSMALGMFYSVVCAEDAPAISEADIERATHGTFLGRTLVDHVLAVCRFWPRGEVAPGYHEAVSSSVPVLLLSGELDPVTPPAHANEVAKHLPNSLHLVVPGVGHGATSVGCIARIVNDFVAAGTTTGLDTRCAQGLKRPPFFLTFAGPKP